MLILTRRTGESIMIGNDAEITVTKISIKGNQVRISNSHFDAVILANARIHLIWGSLDTRLRGYDVK